MNDQLFLHSAFNIPPVHLIFLMRYPVWITKLLKKKNKKTIRTILISIINNGIVEFKICFTKIFAVNIPYSPMHRLPGVQTKTRNFHAFSPCSAPATLAYPETYEPGCSSARTFLVSCHTLNPHNLVRNCCVLNNVEIFGWFDRGDISYSTARNRRLDSHLINWKTLVWREIFVCKSYLGCLLITAVFFLIIIDIFTLQSLVSISK